MTLGNIIKGHNVQNDGSFSYKNEIKITNEFFDTEKNEVSGSGILAELIKMHKNKYYEINKLKIIYIKVILLKTMRKILIFILLMQTICWAGEKDVFRDFFTSFSGIWYGELYEKFPSSNKKLKIAPKISLVDINKYYENSNIFYSYYIYGSKIKREFDSNNRLILDWEDCNFVFSNLYQLHYFLNDMNNIIILHDNNFKKILYLKTNGDLFCRPTFAIEADKNRILFKEDFGIKLDDTYFKYFMLFDDKVKNSIEFIYNTMYEYSKFQRVDEIKNKNLYKYEIIKTMCSSYMINYGISEYDVTDKQNLKRKDSVLNRIIDLYDFINNINGIWEYIIYDANGKEMHRVKVESLLKDGVSSTFVFPVENNIRHIKVFPPQLYDYENISKHKTCCEGMKKISIYPMQMLSSCLYVIHDITPRRYPVQLKLQRGIYLFAGKNEQKNNIDLCSGIDLIRCASSPIDSNSLSENKIIWYKYSVGFLDLNITVPYLKWELSDDWNEITEYIYKNKKWVLMSKFIKTINRN